MKTVVVTGGAKSIGLGVVRGLSEQGWRCVIIDTDETGKSIAAEIDGAFFCVDVTHPDELSSMFAEIEQRFGKIDGLVNSAGLTRTGPSDKVAASDWQLVINVDLSGTFYVCQAAISYMAPGSAIVNLASIAAVRAFPGRAAYTAAKFGVVGLTRVLAVEWADRSIRVNAVGPTWTETPFLETLISSGKLDSEELIKKMPMKRLAQVTDVVNVISFLLSEKASFVTGQTLFVDGGYTWAG